MKYPCLVNTLVYKKINDNEYTVKNCLDCKEYTMDIDAVRFMNKLDGKTDPYSINPNWSDYEVKHFIRFLKDSDNKLVKMSRLEDNGLLSFRFSLFKIKATTNKRIIAWFLNIGLMVLFFPLLISGCYNIYNNFDLLMENYSNSKVIVGSILGLVVGMTLHEGGHAIAGLALRARVFEAGLFLGILGYGAYVILDETHLKSKLKRVQIMAAGIENNLMLTGISGLLFSINKNTASLFFGFAAANLILALTNLLFITGLDGSQIINILLGSDMFCNTIDLVFDKNYRSKVLTEGSTGFVKIATCAFGLLFQLSYPLVLIVNTVSLGSLFVS